MSSLTRPLTGRHLTIDLAREVAGLRGDEAYRRNGRLGRTLVKEGDLRLVMTALAEGTRVSTHRASGPMTLQVLEGSLRYRVAGEVHRLERGQILFFGPGHAEDIQALEDTVLLLNVTGPEADDGGD